MSPQFENILEITTFGKRFQRETHFEISFLRISIAISVRFDQVFYGWREDLPFGTKYFSQLSYNTMLFVKMKARYLKKNGFNGEWNFFYLREAAKYDS